MDNLIRVIARDGSVMCCAVDSTKIAGEAERIHKTSATVTAALGRLLTAGAMMGSMLKNPEDSVTLRLSGGGPAGKFTVVADGAGMVKGDVENPIVEIPLNNYGKLDVAGAVGKDGSLTVIRDLGFAQPDHRQCSHRFWRNCGGCHLLLCGQRAGSHCVQPGRAGQSRPDCRQCGGFLVQLLPGADDSVIDRLEANINKLPAVSQMIADGMTPEQIAFAALEGFEPEILDSRVAEYRCDCSRDRMRRALVSLGQEELARMVEEGENIEVNCHFCGTTHVFTPDEIRSFMQK